MQLTPFLVLAGVLGTAAAHPSGHAHAHHHRSAHVKRDAPSFIKYVHKTPVLPTTSSAAPQPTTTSAAVAAAATSAAADLVTEYVDFCGSSSTSKRATNAQIMYTGNLGTSNGCAWGSNIMKVAESIADKYQYVQKFTNVASEPYQVVCGNKMGADGGLDGMFKVKGQNQLIFTLSPGETQVVVAAGNTQAICAFAPNEVPLTSVGQYAGVWVEVDFGNTSNNEWSGADCSSLVAEAYSMSVPGCQVNHDGSKPSTILPGGQGTNAYTKGTENEDGLGLNLAPGNVLLEIKVGYSG